MRRWSLVPVLATLVGLLLATGDARACCHKHKKQACAAPVAVCEAPAPAPAPAPAVCEAPPKKCCHGFGLFKHLGHKRCCRKAVVVCAPAPCPTVTYAPAVYV